MKNDLSIAQPCSANWEEMSPTEQGRFCGLCSLTVVDFTQMNETEIKEYFTCHYGQKTCGRFKSTQVQNHPTTKETNISFFRSATKTALFCVLTILSMLTGCRKPASISPHLMGDVVGTISYEQPDTTKTNPDPVIPLK